MRRLVPVGAYNTSYSVVRSKCEDAKALDDALAAISWALCNNAEDYPLVRGYKSLRVAKTDPIRRLPPLRVVFTINGDAVNLKWIEFVDEAEFRGPPLM